MDRNQPVPSFIKRKNIRNINTKGELDLVIGSERSTRVLQRNFPSNQIDTMSPPSPCYNPSPVEKVLWDLPDNLYILMDDGESSTVPWEPKSTLCQILQRICRKRRMCLELFKVIVPETGKEVDITQTLEDLGEKRLILKAKNQQRDTMILSTQDNFDPQEFSTRDFEVQNTNVFIPKLKLNLEEINQTQGEDNKFGQNPQRSESVGCCSINGEDGWIHSGCIWKKTNVWNKWVQRYLVLYSQKLIYFTSEIKLQQLGVIPFLEIYNVEPSDIIDGKEFTFLIKTYRRDYIMATEKKEDAQKWVSIVQETLSKRLKCTPKSPRTRKVFAKVVSPIRKMASKERYRLESDGFDFDLTFISANILAMGIPGSGVQEIWRNPLSELCRWLNATFRDKYKIWNLSENRYCCQKFMVTPLQTAFPDHHPPPLSTLFEIVSQCSDWLNLDPEHVAIIHCDGGKGRTGTIIAALMFYEYYFNTIQNSLIYFAATRSRKGRGVTQPGQLRYLTYFETLLTNKSVINNKSITIQKFSLKGFPCQAVFNIYNSVWKKVRIFHSGPIEFNGEVRYDNKDAQDSLINFAVNQTVYGDVYILCKIFTNDIGRKKKAFHVCMNTLFMRDSPVELKLGDLEHVDSGFSKKLPDDFVIRIFFSELTDDVPERPLPKIVGEMCEKFSARVQSETKTLLPAKYFAQYDYQQENLKNEKKNKQKRKTTKHYRSTAENMSKHKSAGFCTARDDETQCEDDFY